ncbi:MAG: regulatory protein RecX [Gemmatimonadota bacterium]
MRDDEAVHAPVDAYDELRQGDASIGTERPDTRPRRSGERAPKRALGDVGEIPVGRISTLHERRAGSSRYIVEIEGHVVATVSSEVISELGLRVGGIIDEAISEQLCVAAGRLQVFDKAITFLAIRSRSVRDLQLRLRRAGAPPPAIASAVERLQALGLLDDEAYARNVARSRALSGGVSRRRIGQELQRLGVARDVADDAVAETLADVGIDEADAAMIVARKRVRSLRSLDPRKQRQRLYAFLARRGYDAGVISRVVASVLADGGDVDGADAGGGDENEGGDGFNESS